MKDKTPVGLSSLVGQRMYFFASLYCAMLVLGLWHDLKTRAAQGTQVPLQPVARADRFGIYNWNINDSAFPSSGAVDRLNWGADKIAELGSRTIRVAISNRDDYRVNPAGTPTLVEIARSPAYDRLFRDRRFQTYLLTAYPRGGLDNNWADGYTTAEYNAERDEIKALGDYLLGNEAFANKTFIVLNWEGDNAIYYYANKVSIWDAYTNWIRARIDGIKLAREARPGSAVRLYSGLEFSAINSPLTQNRCGTPVTDPANTDPLQNRCVIDYVAPQVEADYYSYSSWQSLYVQEGTSRSTLKAAFKEDLDFALGKIRARRPDVGEGNFIVGEYGFERTRYGECYAANQLNEAMDAFDGAGAFKPAYVIFWQIVDNGRLFGAFDERFGLFRVRNQSLTPTLLSQTFRKRMAGESVAPHAGCPRIRQYPEPPGILNQQGTLDFELNPDTIGSIFVPNCCTSTDSPFSPTGNTVHFNQTLQDYQLPRDNPSNFYESRTQLNFSPPSKRRPGLAWVYVTDARGLESNAQVIELKCLDCPKIDTSCGVLDTNWQTLQIEPGMSITISGSQFSTAGNSIVLEQLGQNQTTRRIPLPRENILSESGTKIIARLPANLEPGNTLLHVINSKGVESGEIIFGVSPPCVDCGPRLRPCAGITSEGAAGFVTGASANVMGRFSSGGNQVIIEQFDQYSTLTRTTVKQGAAGWDETDKRIKFQLPASLYPGRALLYVVDPQGRESRAQAITMKFDPVTTVTATHYKGPSLAKEAIAAAFGTALANATQAATTTPLPTELAGTTVTVTDSGGASKSAFLFFVSPTQVNFLVPDGLQLGKASIQIRNIAGGTTNGSIRINTVAPGLFSADSSGKGAAAAVALRIKPDGSQTFEPVVEFNNATNQLVPLPIDLGPPSDQVFLILFGSGLRGRTSLDAVTSLIGGLPMPVTFAGAHPSLIGVDQINIRLARSLQGAGETELRLTVDGLQTNAVRVKIK